MGLFDWFENGSTARMLAQETAQAEHEARLRKFAEFALIIFTYYSARNGYIENDPLQDALTDEEFMTTMENTIKRSEKLVKRNYQRLDEDIEGGLKRIQWMANTVENNNSKLVYNAIIQGALKYESKVQQLMLSQASYTVYSKIREENSSIQKLILENIAQHILTEEYKSLSK